MAEDDDERPVFEKRPDAGKNRFRRNSRLADITNNDTPVTTNNTDMEIKNTNQPAELPEDEQRIIEGASTEVPDNAKFETPLDNPVVERGYTEKKYLGDTVSPITQPTIQTPIISPQVTTSNNTTTPTNPVSNVPPVDKNVQQQQTQQYATDSMGQKQANSMPANPAVTTMGGKEKKEQLKWTVDTVLWVYAKLKMRIGEFACVSDRKLNNLERDKKITADWAVLKDYATGEILTLRQFVQNANSAIMQACLVSEEFKEKMRPLLEAEFDKRGWIVDAQTNALVLLGTDLVEMGDKLLTIRMNMNAVIKKCSDEYTNHLGDTNGLTEREVYNINRHRIFVPYTQTVQQPVQTQSEKVVEPAKPAATTTVDAIKNEFVKPEPDKTTSNSVAEKPDAGKDFTFEPPVE